MEKNDDDAGEVCDTASEAVTSSWVAVEALQSSWRHDERVLARRLAPLANKAPFNCTLSRVPSITDDASLG